MLVGEIQQVGRQQPAGGQRVTGHDLSHVDGEIAPPDDDIIAHDEESCALRSYQNPPKTYLSFLKSLLRVLNLCLSSFYFGYSLSYLGSFEFATIVSVFGVPEEAEDLVEGFMQGSISVGGGAGALLSSVLLRNLSRTNSLYLINGLAVVGGVLVLIPQLFTLFAGRILQGVCTGMYSAIIPLLIKQFSPKELDGTFGALNQTLIASGVFASYAFQWILTSFSPEQDHWRIVFGLTLLTVVAQTLVLLLAFNQETPKYYLLQGRKEDCRKLLQTIYRPEYVDSVLAEKTEDLKVGQSPSNSQTEMKQLDSQNHSLENNKLSNQTLRAKAKRIRVMIALHLAVLQQFVGINVVISYGTKIAQEIRPEWNRLIPSLLNLQQVFATIASSYLLFRVGRKSLLQGGTVFSSISLVAISIGFFLKADQYQVGDSLIIGGLIVFMGNFGLTLGPVVWLYIPQIIEPEMIPFSTLANWASASVVIIAFPILSKALATPIPLFAFFAVWSTLAVFVGKKWLVETRAKSEKEIHGEYQSMVH